MVKYTQWMICSLHFESIKSDKALSKKSSIGSKPQSILSYICLELLAYLKKNASRLSVMTRKDREVVCSMDTTLEINFLLKLRTRVIIEATEASHFSVCQKMVSMNFVIGVKRNRVSKRKLIDLEKNKKGQH